MNLSIGIRIKEARSGESNHLAENPEEEEGNGTECTFVSHTHRLKTLINTERHVCRAHTQVKFSLVFMH